jgi:hypothetical protein
MGKELLNSDKELLLKDLCARLPYGVKAVLKQTNCHNSTKHEVNEKDVYSFRTGRPLEEDYGQHDYYKVIVTDIKPYLFPMSSMTVEQRCKVQNLLPNNCDISFKNQKITFHNEEGSIQLDKLEKLFNFFNLYHIDYRGLIPMGLAIDATGLNIY